MIESRSLLGMAEESKGPLGPVPCCVLLVYLYRDESREAWYLSLASSLSLACHVEWDLVVARALTVDWLLFLVRLSLICLLR